MQIVTHYPDGVFCWIDLATTDKTGAQTFYSQLFEWDILEIPVDENSTYTMFQIEEKNVAGMGEMPQEMQDQGMPTAWTAYIKHDNADLIAEKITAAGGTLIQPPFDVLESGRMLIGQDPIGAIFGVWQPINHKGADLVNQPNTLVWNELQTKGEEAAIAFYSQVFDWGYAKDEDNYVTFSTNGRRQAGMIQMDENWGPEIPPNWAVYIAVEDVESMTAKARELGAAIILPPNPAGEIGTLAVLVDPQGAIFSIIQFNGPTDPPPNA